MEVGAVIVWGFGATIVLTTVMSLSRPLHLTRMDIPFMLGTMFTADRSRSRWLGFLLHLMIGWIFAFVYAAAFETTGFNQWWFGMLIGLVHGSFVLSAGLPLITSIHPRMATEHHGPDPTRQLEPPGFLSKNYGAGTPFVSLIAHLIYGGILGYFYP